MVNLSNFIQFHARRDPSKTALVYRDQRISYVEFVHRIERLGGWLVREGIQPGDVVAVLMKNSAAFLEIAFAISHVGAVLLPVNYRLSVDEVSYIVNDAAARMLLVDDDLAASAGGTDRIVVVDEKAQQDMGAMTGECAPAEPALRRPSDLMRLMYTSGTTARPKGVMHTYENFYWKNAAHQVEFGLSPDTRLLVSLPLYHVGAYDMPGIAVLCYGGTIVLHRDFDAQAVLCACDTERITGTAMAPVMTGMVLAHPDRDRYDVSSVRWIAGGGDKTPESRILAFKELFSNARYVDAYGLTESCSGDTFMAAGRELEKIGSAGRPTLFVEIQIRDADGAVLPPGQTGEICLRGPKITRGYWNDPEKTRASFYGDWFRTGDAGHLDEEGFIYLTDRIKDMIISGGENIASSEVERVIYQLPQVREVAVIGVPDEHWGERPVAIIALNPGASLDLPALADHCRLHLAGFKVPKALRLVESLPRNATGKVLKRELRRTMADQAAPDSLPGAPA